MFILINVKPESRLYQLKVAFKKIFKLFFKTDGNFIIEFWLTDLNAFYSYSLSCAFGNQMENRTIILNFFWVKFDQDTRSSLNIVTIEPIIQSAPDLGAVMLSSKSFSPRTINYYKLGAVLNMIEIITISVVGIIFKI